MWQACGKLGDGGVKRERVEEEDEVVVVLVIECGTDEIAGEVERVSG